MNEKKYPYILLTFRLQGTSGSSPLPTRRLGGPPGSIGGGPGHPQLNMGAQPQFNTLPQAIFTYEIIKIRKR